MDRIQYLLKNGVQKQKKLKNFNLILSRTSLDESLRFDVELTLLSDGLITISQIYTYGSIFQKKHIDEESLIKMNQIKYILPNDEKLENMNYLLTILKDRTYKENFYKDINQQILNDEKRNETFILTLVNQMPKWKLIEQRLVFTSNIKEDLSYLFRQLTNMTTISIEIGEEFKLNQSDLNQFINLISQNKDLNSFSFNNHNSNLTDEHFSIIQQYLNQNNQQLKQLSLLSRSNECYQNLCNSLDQFQSLNSLTVFNRDKNKQFKPQFLLSLNGSYVQNLKFLKVSLIKSVKNLTIKKFGLSLGECSQLEELQLEIKKSNSIHFYANYDKDCYEVLFKQFKQLKKLKSFSLTYEDNELSQELYESLVKSFQQCQQLTKFKLEQLGARFKQSLQPWQRVNHLLLSESLCQLSNLRILDLEIMNNRIDQKVLFLYSLLRSLKKCYNISILTLKLREYYRVNTKIFKRQISKLKRIVLFKLSFENLVVKKKIK